MRRVGYDADTQTYTFRDSDGSHWESAPGNRYGRLTQISGSSHVTASSVTRKSFSASVSELGEDDETFSESGENPPESTERPLIRRFTDFVRLSQNDDSVIRREDWRLLAPFMLIVCLVLLLVWRMLKVDTVADGNES